MGHPTPFQILNRLSRESWATRLHRPKIQLQRVSHPPRKFNFKGCATRREVLPRQFWQRRFHDFNVWSHTKELEKLEYMHFNPVKRKLVRDPKDWPWSSYSHYARGQEGVVAINDVQ